MPHLAGQAEPDFADWTSSMIKGIGVILVTITKRVELPGVSKRSTSDEVEAPVHEPGVRRQDGSLVSWVDICDVEMIAARVITSKVKMDG